MQSTPVIKPRIINLFGGPGVGKSVQAAGIYFFGGLAGLRMAPIAEYAKGRTLLGDRGTLGFQGYVTLKQWFDQARVDERYELMVTDSPFLIGLLYPGRGSTPSFPTYLLELYDEFDNLNILLERNPAIAYDEVGRNQTEEEAEEKDALAVEVLRKYQLPHEVVTTNGIASVLSILHLAHAKWPDMLWRDPTFGFAAFLHPYSLPTNILPPSYLYQLLAPARETTDAEAFQDRLDQFGMPASSLNGPAKKEAA